MSSALDPNPAPAATEGTGLPTVDPISPAQAPSDPNDPALGTSSAQELSGVWAVVKPVSHDDLQRLSDGWHHDPHSILGAHPHEGGLTIRALRPGAESVVAQLPDGTMVPMEHDHAGVWATHLSHTDSTDYRLHVVYNGHAVTQDDPYRFLPTIGEMDLHLFGEGRHEQLWQVMGAHARSFDSVMGEVHGTAFTVWAPNAQAIRLVGEFNGWDGQHHPMRSLGISGVWELFVPGVGENSTYKFRVLAKDGSWKDKSDPMARATECPPATASVTTVSRYQWNDDAWMQERAAHPDARTQPMSVYEVHLGSWRRGLSYRELAEQLVGHVTYLGFTHVEFMPVMEHPYGPSWGYQVTGFYAPTSRFGSPDEFRYLVDALHQAGIGVLLDWVPAHFPRDDWALARFDGQELYEHPDPRRGSQPDWGTLVFDFGRPQVRNFLVANACYWLEEFHIDGLRVDAVASMLYLDYSRNHGEWEPNCFGGRENLEAVQFLQEMNATVYKRYPGVVTIAEESTAWGGVTQPTYNGGLGFGLKWNMGWMHDSLDYVSREPIHRQFHHHQMTFAMMYHYTENFCLPISHDEIVHGKGSLINKIPGDEWQRFAQMRAYLALMWSHPGKQLLMMGTEFAQTSEWNDGTSLDWWLLDHEPHLHMQRTVRELNTLYREQPCLWALDQDPDGFRWLNANDAAGNCYSYLRRGHERILPDGTTFRDTVAVAVNFAGMPHEEYRIGLPYKGTWQEILNTDAAELGGSGRGNCGSVEAEQVPFDGQPYSVAVTVPAMSAVWFAPTP